jgi:predicted nucleic acid-binding protein
MHYKTCQKLGKTTADIRYYQLRRTRLRVVETDEDLSRAAAVEKCHSQHRLSLADCYALALSKREKATLLTTDRELAKVREVKTLHLPV